MNDLIEKEIDQEYRLHQISSIIPYIDKTVDDLINKEKEYLLNYNNKKMYKKLELEKKNGKIFSKDDLNYEVLFELFVIENFADSTIAELYNMRREQVRYLRNKFGITNKTNKKILTHPEIIMYGLEEQKKRPANLSNYEYEKEITAFINREFGNNNNNNNNNNKADDITLNIEGEKVKYHVIFSDEKYSINKNTKTRVNKGTRHNYKKENQIKITHGKIGEQLVLEIEKKRLIEAGLKNLAGQVQLVAQIDEETTLDGLGYDLISFNENKEQICIEVKTTFSKTDKPFFISKKEIELMKGLKKEYNCKYCLIYYVLIDKDNVVIKIIRPDEFSNIKLTPILYKVEESN